VTERERFTFEVGAHGSVTACSYRADDPIDATLILAHGAGASQASPFMVDMATRLAERGIDIVTFDFLYMERQKKMPDRVEVLEAAWRAAIASVRARAGLPTRRCFIGGKSMGGRIASHVAAADRGIGLTGLVFLGYPLHPPKKPRVRRDAHLKNVPFPMLFVQGTRDELGTAKEIEDLAATLKNTHVHAVEGGDHSLALPRAEGAKQQEKALDRAANAIQRFIAKQKKERGKR
jgi:uncharacterized protein